ncbi:hypothetical protein [Mycolicibacterium fortuitum]|uniref:hypothetical protein n=1 Tax=Mycolicibacterium fortuitum TaxID=1766 RepID=UPI002620102D|nr:hypothetical protein [Mycolicibacterium fortuitum]
MVAAVLSMPKASRKMTELSELDRSWLVAGLTLAGVTAQDIADRMGCSLRLVRAIRAESITQFAVVAQTESHALGNELRAERCEHSVTRRELAVSRAEVDRLRGQVDELVKALAKFEPVRVCPKKHPMVGYNVYRHGGREYCRECNRLRAIDKRQKRSQEGRTEHAEQQRHNRVVTVMHAGSVASAS